MTNEETRSRYEKQLRFKDETITNLTAQVEDLSVAAQRAEKGGRSADNIIEELRRENSQLKDQLMDKLLHDLDDDAIGREIANIRDPASFGALKAILARSNKFKDEIANLKDEISRQGSVQKALSDAQSKVKQKDGEIKTLKAEIKSLMNQTEFLLRELEFVQKRQQQGKPVGPMVQAQGGNSAGAGGQNSDANSQIIKEICGVLKIKDSSQLVNSVRIIEEAYQLLPALQSTVETIFKVVYEGNIFETPLNSYDVNLRIIIRTYLMQSIIGLPTSKTTKT